MSLYKSLQDSFSNVLNDLISMSADVIRKSGEHLKDLQCLDATNIDAVSKNIKILLEKINTNVDTFLQTSEDALNKHNLEITRAKTQTTIKRKLNLSLKKNEEENTTKVDLTCSDDEDLTTNPPKNKEKDVQNENETLKPTDEDSASDSDSDKSIQRFDVTIPKDSQDGETDSFVKYLNDISKNDDAENVKIEVKKKFDTYDSMSFDFDDVDVKENQEKTKHELLDLLNKVIGDFKDRDMQATNEEVDEALKMLEEDHCMSSDSDSLSSWPTISDDEEESEKIERKEQENEEDHSTDEEKKQSEQELVVKDFHITLDKKLDEMDDKEIEALCQLHNLNKRKCTKEIKKYSKPKVKRHRILSTTSTSSDSSFDSSTQDLVIDTQGSPTNENCEPPDNSALADQLAEQLVNENEDKAQSSDEEEEEETEEPPEKKKKKCDKESDEFKECAPVNEEADQNGITEEKRLGSWRANVLWSDTDDEDDDMLLMEKEVTEISDQEDFEDEIKKSTVSKDVTMVIDSDGSDTDDVTFVDVTTKDDAQGKGRRNIRAILSDNELNELTQIAKSEEDERVTRLEQHTRTIETIQSQREEFVLDVDVNTGSPLIIVDSHLTNKLKPHQKQGVQFMWEACYESVKKIREKRKATGCILAHCMGLGKTLQVITLVHTLFKYKETQTKHVLIICPLSTVLNWRNEFRINLNKPWGFHLWLCTGDFHQKISIIKAWRQSGGILITNYETFTTLTTKNKDKLSEQQKKFVFEALLDPGPDLIVCDEGHQLKNSQTYKTQALMQIKTARRIVLTGTPLQNNLTEYYTMVQFVKPHLLGTFSEYKNRFATPIKNGQFHNSKPEDIKLMKKRTHVLTKLLKKTIHRAESSILAQYLPEITDNSLFIKLTQLQLTIYKKYIEAVTMRTCDLSKAFLQDVMILGFNNLHPYTLVLYYNKPKPKKKPKKKPDDVSNDDEQSCDFLNHVNVDWYKTLMPEDVATNVEYSAKLKIVLNLVDETIKLGQKILIFAQYLVELDVIEHFLKVHSKDKSLPWRVNIDYFRMDGSTPVTNRNKLCEEFNKQEGAKVFLLTHRVGGLGLNLTGANRVIMIGSNHNPSLDTQSMYRVYRFGQNKECYVYRLLSLATMEEKIYHRCVVKLVLSGTVVDKLHFARTYASTDLEEMYKLDFSDYEKERPVPALPNDKLLATLLLNIAEIYSYLSQKSLLEHRPEEELTDEDKKLAWDEFNNIEAAARSGVLNPPALQGNTGAVINPVRMSLFTAKNLIPANSRPIMVRNPLSGVVRHFVPQDVPPPNAHAPRFLNPPILLHSVNRPQFTQRPRFPASNQLRVASEQIRSAMRRNFEIIPNRNDEAPSTSGEFNYALNKVIQ